MVVFYLDILAVADAHLVPGNGGQMYPPFFIFFWLHFSDTHGIAFVGQLSTTKFYDGNIFLILLTALTNAVTRGDGRFL